MFWYNVYALKEGNLVSYIYSYVIVEEKWKY